MSLRCLLALMIAALVSGTALQADDAKPAKPAAAKPGAAKAAEGDAAEKAGDMYTVPKGADVEALMKFVKEIQEFQPTSVEQARTHQRKGRIAIGDAARAILKVEKDTKSEAYLFAKTFELGSEIGSLTTASEEERKAFCDQIAELLQSPHAGKQQVSLAMNVASRLEQLDETATAIDAYKKFGAALSKSADKDIAENGQMLIGAARRLELPGKPIKLAGNTFDGAKFDVANLKGKVVLVDFWATWCGPCVAEIPNMKRMYKKYHDQGFEIVGLSLDQDRNDLKDFLAEKELPWTILHDKENDGQHPAVTEYGVFGIPCMILVGKDGKVIDTQARGEKLQELLEKQFDSKDADAPASKNATGK